MAMTKFRGLFLNLKHFETASATSQDTSVCAAKMKGMTASSANLPASNCEANLLKTGYLSVILDLLGA